MRTELSFEQIESYRDNGFVVIDNFLTPDELEEWRAAVDGAVTKRGHYRPAEERAGSNATFYTRVFIQSLQLWKDSDAVKKLVLDPRIGKMCCELEGVDGFRVWHDQALIKEPWANPTSFHLDNPYWSFTSRHSISIWVALDDATEQNGCLYFLPKSHQTARHENVGIGPNMNGLFAVYPEWATIKPFVGSMKAGSCSFHNGLMAHGAGANMTPGYRRAMTCAYMPDGSTFNGTRNILTEEQVSKLKIGDLLDDPDQNPLVYSVHGA
ncbi:MAG: phytanoyl-CoA dioxygenase family protein [Candidatus Poribacteria bacterium]|nr:phytanoyl-CoA dioxygenase family protein [Candidatus Poribacteria bacterium]